MTDRETILHGLRDRDDDARIAVRRMAERVERAEEAAMTERENCAIMARNWRESMNKFEAAEDRVKELESALWEIVDLVPGTHLHTAIELTASEIARAALAGRRE